MRELTCHDNAMKGWRCYRIEYGYECSCPEGVIWLPPDVVPEVVEEFLVGLTKTWVPNAKRNLD